MKKAILTVALLAGLSVAIPAQTGNTGTRNPQKEQMTPDQRAAKDAARAQQELGLTADQTSKWQAASLVRIQANEPLREKSQGSTTPEEREQLRNQMKVNNDAFENTVSGFLTPEQKTKFDQNKKNMRGMHKGDGNHGGGNH